MISRSERGHRSEHVLLELAVGGAGAAGRVAPAGLLDEAADQVRVVVARNDVDAVRAGRKADTAHRRARARVHADFGASHLVDPDLRAGIPTRVDGGTVGSVVGAEAVHAGRGQGHVRREHRRPVVDARARELWVEVVGRGAIAVIGRLELPTVVEGALLTDVGDAEDAATEFTVARELAPVVVVVARTGVEPAPDEVGDTHVHAVRGRRARAEDGLGAIADAVTVAVAAIGGAARVVDVREGLAVLRRREAVATRPGIREDTVRVHLVDHVHEARAAGGGIGLIGAIGKDPLVVLAPVKVRLGDGGHDVVEGRDHRTVITVQLVLRRFVPDIGRDLDVDDALAGRDTGSHGIAAEDGVVGGAVVTDHDADLGESVVVIRELGAQEVERLLQLRLGHRDLPVDLGERGLSRPEVGERGDAVREADHVVGGDLLSVDRVVQPVARLLVADAFVETVEVVVAEGELKGRDGHTLKDRVEIGGEEAVPGRRVRLGDGHALAARDQRHVRVRKPVREHVVALVHE